MSLISNGNALNGSIQRLLNGAGHNLVITEQWDAPTIAAWHNYVVTQNLNYIKFASSDNQPDPMALPSHIHDQLFAIYQTYYPDDGKAEFAKDQELAKLTLRQELEQAAEATRFWLDIENKAAAILDATFAHPGTNPPFVPPLSYTPTGAGKINVAQPGMANPVQPGVAARTLPAPAAAPRNVNVLRPRSTKDSVIRLR